MRAKRPAPGEILNAESTIESQYLKLRGRCWYATVCWKTCSRGAYCSLAVGVLRALIHNLIGRELHSYNVQTDSYGFIGLLLLASRSPLLAESFTQSDQLSPSDAAAGRAPASTAPAWPNSGWRSSWCSSSSSSWTSRIRELSRESHQPCQHDPTDFETEFCHALRACRQKDP